jgi:hypothetical protein
VKHRNNFASYGCPEIESGQLIATSNRLLTSVLVVLHYGVVRGHRDITFLSIYVCVCVCARARPVMSSYALRYSFVRN